MNVLMLPNNEILAILGEQPIFNNLEYKLLTNCLVENVEGGKLLFNGLTRSIVFMTDLEYSEMFSNIDKYLYLYKYYFIVPKDFNEIETIDKVKNHFRTPIDDVYLNHPTGYTILTTTKCNARCFYCYELKSKKANMSQDTAKKVAEYIIKHSYRNNPIKLAWFGGEPLFNMKVIDTITLMLRDAGLNFYSDFTTNGYLFDQDLIIKAKNSWNISSVQITIDGTEQVYNKAKNYIYKNGESPYKRVINNIKMLLRENITVTIRLNLDSYNCDNLKQLVDELYTIFGNNPNLNIYCWPIFENSDYQRTDAQRAFVFKELEEIENIIKSYGYLIGTVPNNMIAHTQCMADNGKHITISPNGELGVCEHCVDYDFWGIINSEEKDIDIFKSWRQYEPVLDICKDCPIYGSCIRLSKCEEMSKCDPYYKEWKLRKARWGLQSFYKRIQNYECNNIAK